MNEQQADADPLESAWATQSSVLRSFIEFQPLYNSLGNEIAYMLEKRLKEDGIQTAAVTCRAKAIRSFCEKISRKTYTDPLTQITDLAGVRIVYLYKNDRPKIEALIEKEFSIIEKLDKTEAQESDQFGYGALHYIASLGNSSSGARYDDLKKLVCEIQVRTVLQDAWAIIAHHLSYKQESAVPKALKRKLNSLSGLFETADDQFFRLREEREAHVAKVMEKVSRNEETSDKDLDVDVLAEYIVQRFPGRDQAIHPGFSELLSELQLTGYTTLSKLNNALKGVDETLEDFEKKFPPQPVPGSKHPGYSPIGCVRVALSIVDDAFLEFRVRKYPTIDFERYRAFRLRRNIEKRS